MFDPLDFLKLASELQGAGQDESKLRTSIGRAYFSVFLFSREWLKAKGWPFNNSGGDHGSAEQGLKKNVDRATGDMLGSLRRTNRGDADYDLSKPITQGDATTAIALANTIISNINTKSKPVTP